MSGHVRDEDDTTAPASPLAEDIASLLDEIDAVLEDDAERFVRNYVQTGSS